MIPFKIKKSGTDIENQALAAASAAWSVDMLFALNNGCVAAGENPTAEVEAILEAGGKAYVATLTYSIREVTTQ